MYYRVNDGLIDGGQLRAKKLLKHDLASLYVDGV